jgi:hypothetical protein
MVDGNVNELVRWQSDNGGVIVEVDASESGFQSVSRKPGEVVHDVRARFDDALDGVHNAVTSALEKFRDGIHDVDSVEIEFGVKLNAEVGSVIAKTSGEGHMIVKLSWSRPASTGG